MMMRWLAVSLAAVAAMTVVVPARACSPVAIVCVGGPCSGPAYERQQREAIARARRADQRRLDAMVRQGLANPATDFAGEVATALVPPLMPNISVDSGCGFESFELDRAGFLSRDELAATLFVRAGPIPRVGVDDIYPSSLRTIPPLIADCNREFRSRVADLLRSTFNQRDLRQSWAQLTRWGALELAAGQRPQRALRFVEGRSGPLIVNDFWNDYRTRQRVERYFAGDGQGVALRTAVAAAITDLRGDGSEQAVCPATATIIVAEIGHLRDDLVRRSDRRAPRRVPVPVS